MAEAYDVGVLIHFADAISEQLEIELLELARKWDACADCSWPFGVAILPVGEYLMFVFADPVNANLFITHVERRLQTLNTRHHDDQLYTIVMCWTGVVGGQSD